MRIVTTTKVYEVRTEQDIQHLYKQAKLHCSVCMGDIYDSRYKTIIEHNAGGIRDGEAESLCYACFDKLRFGWKKLSTELSKYEDKTPTDGEMKITNTILR